MASLESVMCLTRSAPKLISPCFETPPPHEEALYLSELDLSYQKYVEFIVVYPKSDCRFPNTREPLEEVLAKALVFYYPFAGRYRESVDGRLEVLCNGEGILFAEARSQCTLDRVAYLDEPYIPFDDSSIFVPTDPTLPRQLLPLVTFQEAVSEDVKFWHVTKAIKNAKASVDEEYVKSVIDLFSTVDKDKTMLHEYLLRTNMIFNDLQ